FDSPEFAAYDGGFTAALGSNGYGGVDGVFVSWPYDGYDTMGDVPVVLYGRSSATPNGQWIPLFNWSGNTENGLLNHNFYEQSAGAWDLGPLYLLFYNEDQSGNPLADTFQLALDFGGGHVQVVTMAMPEVQVGDVASATFDGSTLSWEFNMYGYAQFSSMNT